MRQLLEEHGVGPGSIGRVFAHGEVQAVFDLMIDNGQKSTRFSSRICAVLLEYLVLKIAESLVPGKAVETPAFATYQRCRRYVQEHFATIRSLDQIARPCHVDPAYLCRLFRRYDHQTPHQYTMRLKMNLAAQRLQDPGTLVKQVAGELGFDDPFHFSRAFKSFFGRSPQAFRRLR